MRKFWAFSKTAWQLTLAYRAESLVWFLIEAVPMIPMLALWLSMLRAGRIDEQQASYLVWYYVLALIISRVTANHFEEWVIDDIKDGSIAKNLLKPFSMKVYLLANELAWRAAGLVYLLPIVFILEPVLKNLERIEFHWVQVGVALIILTITFLQRFFVSWLIALSAFWMQQAKSLAHLKWMLEGILGGAWLPLYFFPGWLQRIAELSPFYLWFYLPIQLILKEASWTEMVMGVILAIGWLGVLYVVEELMWKRALAKFSATGG